MAYFPATSPPSSVAGLRVHTIFVPVEKDALGLEDQDNVFRVGPIKDPCRFCAKELVGLVDFLKHFLKE